MGRGINLYCPNCGFTDTFDLGVGFSYPRVFVDTMEKAKSGRQGKKLKKLLIKHPEVVVDPEIVLMVCPKCHWLFHGMDLTAYIPKPGYDRSKEPKRVWSSASRYNDLDYVSPADLRLHYDIIQKYDHSCERCGTELELIHDNEIGQRIIPCRKCGTAMTARTVSNWD